jgi:hypothetical protein
MGHARPNGPACARVRECGNDGQIREGCQKEGGRGGGDNHLLP